MPSRRRSTKPTEPPPLLAMMEADADSVARFDPVLVRAATMRQRTSRAVAAALREAEVDRETIAERMSAYLGEAVSVAVLNKYASQSAGEHDISVARFLALVHATGDARLLQSMLEPLGLAAISEAEQAWIKVGKLVDQQEALERKMASAKAMARGGRR